MTDDGDRAALEDERDFLLRVARGPRARARRGRHRRRTTTRRCGTTTPSGPRAVLRALEAERAPRRRRPAARPWRRTAVGGRRSSWPSRCWPACSWRSPPGGATPATPPPATSARSITEKLNEAGRLQRRRGPGRRHRRSTTRCWPQDPDNVEALTYKGWALHAVRRRGRGPRLAARRRPPPTPTYPDVHAFLAIVLLPQRAGRPRPTASSTASTRSTRRRRSASSPRPAGRGRRRPGRDHAPPPPAQARRRRGSGPWPAGRRRG